MKYLFATPLLIGLFTGGEISKIAFSAAFVAAGLWFLIRGGPTWRIARSATFMARLMSVLPEYLRAAWQDAREFTRRAGEKLEEVSRGMDD